MTAGRSFLSRPMLCTAPSLGLQLVVLPASSFFFPQPRSSPYLLSLPHCSRASPAPLPRPACSSSWPRAQILCSTAPPAARARALCASLAIAGSGALLLPNHGVLCSLCRPERPARIPLAELSFPSAVCRPGASSSCCARLASCIAPSRVLHSRLLLPGAARSVQPHLLSHGRARSFRLVAPWIPWPSRPGSLPRVPCSARRSPCSLWTRSSLRRAQAVSRSSLPKSLPRPSPSSRRELHALKFVHRLLPICHALRRSSWTSSSTHVVPTTCSLTPMI
ncbi:uncharacterized protein LOC100193932 [Zea mays]|uniref:Uncharacterized protein n=2 Tax=Zea mays TaxID=4577 RepID=B4FGT2_MAIZE|nr:uncharacterized protein LOC100193932 [Zea mays]ACF81325.1 unknown [Zea mays]|eukprot:NP_001132475.1 uncharacterized protein LOC100193932 [Zea mays]